MNAVDRLGAELRAMHLEGGKSGCKAEMVILFGIRYAAEIQIHGVTEIVRRSGIPGRYYGSKVRKGIKLAKLLQEPSGPG